MKLLVVEDEPKTGDYLCRGLVEAGYTADLVGDGADGLQLALTGEYALIVLDVALPVIDGWQVLGGMRQARVNQPVLFLTARDRVDDRVKGLELGADDRAGPSLKDSEISVGFAPGRWNRWRGARRSEKTGKESQPGIQGAGGAGDCKG